MEDIYKEPDRKAWLKAEINRHEYARQRLNEAKVWLMIPKAEPEDVDIYLEVPLRGGHQRNQRAYRFAYRKRNIQIRRCFMEDGKC